MGVKTNPLENNFVGPFSDLIMRFIELKISQGYKYACQGHILSKFSHLSFNHQIENCILSKELVQDWRDKNSQVKSNTLAQALFPVRDFALYLIDLGYEAHVPIIPRIPISSFVPHIFTQDELSRFFQCSDNIQQRNHYNSTMPIVFPVLFRMLFGCGLRISEALNLKIGEVDLEEGILTILKAKGNKDRFVPMSESLTKICQAYVELIHAELNANDFFFCMRNRKRLCETTIFERYKKVLQTCGIKHQGKGYGPRVHDFRHTYAVLSMRESHRKGVDIYYFMPILSNYMGHENVYDTEKYIRLPTEFHSEVRNAVSKETEYIIPEVSI